MADEELKYFNKWLAGLDGGQAFPLAAPPSQAVTPGMTLLEWYAGMALPTLLQHPQAYSTGDAVEDSINVAKAMIRRLADVQKETTGQGCMAQGDAGEEAAKVNSCLDTGGCGANHCCNSPAAGATVTPV